METLTLPSLRSIQGEITLPGSKSLSNRILLLAAVAKGETRISNLLDSDDVRHMLGALARLGVNYQLSADKKECIVTGLGGGFTTASPLELFLGNAGTAMRPLCAMLCASTGEVTLTGEPRMLERPIGDLVDCLRGCGASVDYLGDESYPPLRVPGKGLRGGRWCIKGNLSSQFPTPMLFAPTLSLPDLKLRADRHIVCKPYILITLDVMARFGVSVENHDYKRFVVRAGQHYQAPGDIMVEGDASSASYFLAAAAIAGGTVRVHGSGRSSVQGDVRFADVLEQMGAKVTWGDTWIEVTRGELNGVDVDLNHIPDAAMTIATTALFAKGTTAIRNVYNLRVKETDRLAALSTELRKVGATVEEGEDYLVITPPEHLHSAAIDTNDDHRMAMCFSLAAFADGTITINDPACTSKTFPTYFTQFLQLATPR